MKNKKELLKELMRYKGSRKTLFYVILCMLFTASSPFLVSYMLERCIDSALMNELTRFIIFSLIFILVSLMCGIVNYHYGTTADITDYLLSKGINVHRQTIPADIELLCSFGFDIITNRSRQNEYFYGSRDFELAELKMMVDAIQAARFITVTKSERLIKKLAKLTSVHCADELNRQLFVAGRVKATNENILYTVDLLYAAITARKQIKFQYYEYNRDKKKVLKHGGQEYEFSPYDLAWCNDTYYVFGWSESHGKVIKFRVDRIYKPRIAESDIHPIPEDYDLPAYIRRTFYMYDDYDCTVELLCDNELMKTIVDRFGEEVQTRRADAERFIATVDVSVSSTFYSWVFTYVGKIKIVSPPTVVEDYRARLQNSIEEHQVLK